MARWKKVETVRVKRTFVTAQLVKVYGGKNGPFDTLLPLEFKLSLVKARRETLQMSEAQLDAFIAEEYPLRVQAYNDCTWYMRKVRVKEVGVWRKARSLPIKWTDCSLKETAAYIEKIPRKSTFVRARVRVIIKAIIRTGVLEYQNEKYLLPILFKGGSGTDGREALRSKTKWDIDDGCMRAVALTLSGRKTLKAYVGIPIKKRKPAE